MPCPFTLDRLWRCTPGPLGESHEKFLNFFRPGSALKACCRLLLNYCEAPRAKIHHLDRSYWSVTHFWPLLLAGSAINFYCVIRAWGFFACCVCLGGFLSLLVLCCVSVKKNASTRPCSCPLDSTKKSCLFFKVVNLGLNWIYCTDKSVPHSQSGAVPMSSLSGVG